MLVHLVSLPQLKYLAVPVQLHADHSAILDLEFQQFLYEPDYRL